MNPPRPNSPGSSSRGSLHLLYLDVGSLKQANDARSHAAGDEGLCTLVSTLKHSVRAGDRVARLGGDEFAVLLAEADAHAGDVASRRLRSALDQHLGQKAGVTSSFGLVTCLAVPRSVDELIEQADKMMYEAKRGGKDAILVGVYDSSA